MPILLLLAGVVILAGVVSVAMGHGGEMAEFAMDYLPPDVITAADVAMLRPPSAFWGYNVQVTDEALSQAAQAITEREVEIAVLRQQLADLRSATGSHPAITAAALLARSKARADAPAVNAARLDPPRPDSPGLDSPGLDSPGLDSPGLDSPGLDSPGLDSPGLDSPGLDKSGLDGPGLGTPPRPAGDLLAPDPGSGTGPADAGPADAGLADAGPADTGPAPDRAAPRSGETAASRDE